jgi:hypothetical protein
MSQTQITSSPPTTAQKLLRICVVALFAGLLLSIIGPFGTFERMDALERFSFWGGAVAIGTLIHIPLFYGAAFVGLTQKWPAWLWVMGSALVAALPMTFVVNGIAATLFPGGAMDSAVSLYPMVLAISTPMQWVAYFTSDLGRPVTQLIEPTAISTPTFPQDGDAPSALPTESSTQAAFFARLPARLGKDLICLEMEDHYVRIHTKLGDTMIHLRMSDAVNELDGIDGMLVHRSWWVARDAITGWSRDGKTLLLQLSNGKSVPVARDRQPLVRAAGWLE